MALKAPLITQALIRAYHERRIALLVEAKQLPGTEDIVSVFFEAEDHIVEAFINRRDAFGVKLVATPMNEMQGPAVCYTITGFDDSLPAHQPLTGTKEGISEKRERQGVGRNEGCPTTEQAYRSLSGTRIDQFRDIQG